MSMDRTAKRGWEASKKLRRKMGKAKLTTLSESLRSLWKCRFRGHPRSSDSDRILGGRAQELAF